MTSSASSSSSLGALGSSVGSTFSSSSTSFSSLVGSGSGTARSFTSTVLGEAVAMGQAPFGQALLSSISMIWATELGDKTFFIAALMAMQYSPIVTFSGAAAALVVMTLLSTIMGHILPAIIPPKFTNFVAVILFFVFGVKMLREAYHHSSSGGLQESEEMREAMETVKAKSEDVENPNALSDLGPSGSGTPKGRPFTRFSPVFAQAFTLTFLAEWGDRSQLATIALGSTMNPYGVILGAIVGHCMCTGLAVFGGQFLARRVSFKAVNYLGGVLFLVFAVLTLIHQEMVGSAAAGSGSSVVSPLSTAATSRSLTSSYTHTNTHTNTNSASWSSSMEG